MEGFHDSHPSRFSRGACLLPPESSLRVSKPIRLHYCGEVELVFLVSSVRLVIWYSTANLQWNWFAPFYLNLFASCLLRASTDLQMYLEHDTVEVDENSSFNVLLWWKTNSCMYPVLSSMAKDILGIPASSVASEAAFSTGGRVVSEKRASLSPNTIEALICLKDWSLATCRKQEAAAEEAAAEELMNARTSRPDWLVEESEEVIHEANYATASHDAEADA